ncbi:endonuclease/exonuclease/phosphatase family protein [Streptomyces erythrochromogenes]|uniref:endonuclease/exonuclease/phosphatase family protein n=1 Tax=Streptomyces erythrochromogenes TaxID=285574 RepID=UPI00224F0D3F|nr:endonuclease/exonuclease/phosphatase family protein [Streptomyces erythrochromogenes]MCX5583802.1 endonuclease/exonuclease/phosphatase family protein [Streptomyces erythrochromogenes]
MRRTPAALAVLTLTAAALSVLAPPAPRAAAAGTVRLTSYNICGNMCAAPPYDRARRIAAVVDEADPGGWAADQLFLQEVCEHQYRELLDRLGPLGYTGFHSATLPGGNPTICEGYAYGNAVLVRGPVSDTAELDLTVGGEREPITVPCVLASLADRPTWSCSVHLYWDDGTLAVPEADRLAARAHAWLDDGFAVVLGGDFNHSPRTDTLSRFYLPERGDGAHGAFVEADESDPEFFDPALCPPATTTACRSGETTFGPKKLDYVFLSAPHVLGATADALALDTTVSDHDLLRVTATTA